MEKIHFQIYKKSLKIFNSFFKRLQIKQNKFIKNSLNFSPYNIYI